MPLRAGIAARASAPLSGRSTPILITGAGPPNRQELHTAKAKAATAAAWGRSTCRLSRFRLAALWQYLYSSFPLTPAVSWPRVRGVSPLLRGARVKTESTEHLKPRSQYAEEAVQLAIAGNWDDAVKLNKFIIDNLGPDEESQNRLGKALSELGKLKDAKAAYEVALKLNPMNTIAKKNAARINTLLHQKEALKVGGTRVDLNLFVEEMGKTIITALEGASADICSKVAAGDVAELKVDGDSIVAETSRGVKLGTLEAKLARRLIKFMRGGNRYQGGVTACDGNTVKLIVRETYQDAKFAGKPSFPMRRKREVEFRPYTKESLLTRGSGTEVFTDDEDEETLVEKPVSDDLEEGMHAVQDDAEPADFSEDADADEDEDEVEN